MRLLVLGANGMLGHQLVESLRSRHEVQGTVWLGEAAYSGIRKFLPETVHYGIDVRDYSTVDDLLHRVRPDAVINAVGIIKQRDDAHDAVLCVEVNALLPHRLAATCAEISSRLVQMSTDCVFSGRSGMYSESDLTDACDLYGRSKLLSEVVSPGALTLRTSIIGLELSRKVSLIEWFLAQQGPVKGFRKAIYSGFTTLEMARIIEHALVRHPTKSGLYHVSSEPIDKYSLLCMLRDRLGRPADIVPDDEFICDRSLDSTRFRSEFGYTPPDWGVMLDDLAAQIRERYSC
ncbi:MAG: SDR family oxidoreductase [Gemmatimonadaceae bacterium]